MSLEYRFTPQEETQSLTSMSEFPKRLSRLKLSIASAVMALTGCASVFEHDETIAPVIYSVETFPVSDPSLVTIDEIAAITSDRFAPERLQELLDSLEIAEGNIRFHRVLIARETLHPGNSSQTIPDLQKKKFELECEAQQVVNLFCGEARLEIPYKRLQYPDAFQLKLVFDAEEEYQGEPGRFNTFLLHQMKREEAKLRHLRLMHSLCRSQLLADEEKTIQLRQLSMVTNMTESGIQLLQNTFHKKQQR
jgi:hypothetical protein